jgi:hypothetical protein
MPRKSRELRLSQAQGLLSNYESASYQGREVSFVRDMILRMERSKQMSPKQRTWLDQLIEQGVPAPKGDADLVSEMEHLLEVPGTDHIRNTLRDFLFRERKGWSLSVKQRAFRERLLEEARGIERNGPWIPSNEQTEKLRLCLELVQGRTNMYWSTHPGEQKAITAVTNWMSEETKFIDEWSVNKTLHSFRAKLAEIENPYCSPGDIVWSNSGTSRGTMALVTGEPEIIRGQICYPVLINGASDSLMKGQLTKRRPRGVKCG